MLAPSLGGPERPIPCPALFPGLLLLATLPGCMQHIISAPEPREGGQPTPNYPHTGPALHGRLERSLGKPSWERKVSGAERQKRAPLQHRQCRAFLAPGPQLPISVIAISQGRMHSTEQAKTCNLKVHVKNHKQGQQKQQGRGSVGERTTNSRIL